MDRKPLILYPGPHPHHQRKFLSFSSARDFIFKAYVISSMTILWSAHALMLRYTRVQTDRPMYYSTTVVFLSELCKFSTAILLLFRDHNFKVSTSFQEIRTDFLQKPKELLKMSVPSILYAVQNNLDFVALGNLDPGVYQVTCQLKVVTTAIFMVLMLGRRYSLTRWCAIVLLFGGVAMVQLNVMRNDANSKKSNTVDEFNDSHNLPGGISMMNRSVEKIPRLVSYGLEHKQNYLLGLSAVLTTCLTAGFSGVYFEKMLKDNTASLWIRNMQMYFTGFLSAGLACVLKEGSQILDNGFFYGYYDLVFIIVGLLSLGGIFISLVIKYLDNLLKSFASAASISIVSFISAFVFGSVLDVYFTLGSATVIFAILLYNYVEE